MTGQLRHPNDLDEALGINFSDEQRSAITAPLAPAVIIAGAGSGKTTVMAARVVWLVGTGQVSPEQVLGLTFTRKAAAELSARIRGALARAGVIDAAGVDDSGEQLVLTYDAFAARLVSEHGMRIGLETDPVMITGASRFRLASRVVEAAAGPFEHLSKFRPDTITQRVLDLDAELTAHLVTREAVGSFTRDFLQAVAEAPLNRTRSVYESMRRARAAAEERLELLGLVADYAALKRELGYVEFADQMAAAARLVQHSPEVGAALRGQFRVVLLDEYQDTSSAQAVLLRGLFSGSTHESGRGHAVTAVGDPCQAIYGWRGAAASNILSFAHEFLDASGNPATRFALTVNRRSGPRVLQAANELAANLRADPAMDFEAGGLQLVAPPGTAPGQVEVASFDTWPEEVRFIADRIVAARASGQVATWSDVAVLTRRNAHIGTLYSALLARDVPVEIVGLGGLLEVPEVSDVVAVLALLDDVGANPSLVRLLTGPRWAIGPADLALLGRRAIELLGEERGSGSPELEQALVEALARTDAASGACLAEALDDPGDLAYSAEARHRFARLARELRWLRAHSAEPVIDLVRRVVVTLGLEVELGSVGRDAVQLGAFLDAVAAYAAVDGEASLNGLLAYLEAEREHGSGLDQAVVSSVDSVKLLTVHKSKGLEWDLVFVPALAADVFPSLRVTGNWMRTAGVVPSPLRGDADSIPQPDDVNDPAAQSYAKALTAEARFAEDRLIYVAVTRARRHLVATKHTWAPGLAKPRQASPYHQTLASVGQVVTVAPAVTDHNPLIVGVSPVAWPVSEDAEGWARRVEAAEAVSALIAEPSAAADDQLDTLDDAAIVAGWDLAISQLTTTTRGQERLLPSYLSATGLARAAAAPADYLADLRRPMPRLASRRQRQGSRFHRWVEERFRLDPALAPDLELADDPSDAEFAALTAAFERGSFGTRRPLAVEVPFSTTIGGLLVRGRLDAVYRDGDGDVVIDWKTGSTKRADPTQLAIYRVAWAELTGVPVQRVRAGFFDVLADHVVYPEALHERTELEEQVRSLGWMPNLTP